MSTAAEQLAAIETVIDARLSGGAIIRHSSLSISFEKESLTDLYKIRDRLAAQVARQNRGMFRYARMDQAVD